MYFGHEPRHQGSPKGHQVEYCRYNYGMRVAEPQLEQQQGYSFTAATAIDAICRVVAGEITLAFRLQVAPLARTIFLTSMESCARTSTAAHPPTIRSPTWAAEGLDLHGLRRQWRAHLGGEAPAHLSRWFLRKVLAYRLQSDAFGDLDKSIRRILRSGKEDGVGAPFDRRAPRTREGWGLQAGALLVSEWNGRLNRDRHHVGRRRIRDSGRKTVEGVGYLTRVIGFPDKPAALWQELQLAAADPRCDDDFNRWPSMAHCLREFDPIHRSRHVNVGEHNSDIVPVFQDANRFVRVRRPEGLKPRVANHVDREHKDKRLVLNRENHPSTGTFQCNAFRVARPEGRTLSGNEQRSSTSATDFRSAPDR